MRWNAMVDRCFNRVRVKPDWMQTFSNVMYYPASPRAQDVRIIDIAHALSMLCRFTGHVRRFYSVAEHSVLLSYIVPEEYALIGLLHDATEAYTNDINRPLKRSLPDYKRIEKLNWFAIADRFGLPYGMPGCIHEADNAMCQAERLELMCPNEHDDWRPLGDPADVDLRCWSPDQAESEFMQRFYQLTRSGNRRPYHVPLGLKPLGNHLPPLGAFA